ncbi:Pentatricopeptide repeat-containing protein [Ananas comosus]|uniref:Pentatricopeptide repeat-containing protein n=1 Tax=Ananas comosus TaxID=4615 RepID=A0A199ULL4_ANACO|nr:Pentatricopeptide repeat-containing protein [Ananas comosus]
MLALSTTISSSSSSSSSCHSRPPQTFPPNPQPNLNPNSNPRRSSPREEALPNLFASFSTPSELQQLHAHLIKRGLPASALPSARVAAVCALSSPSTFSYARRLLRRSAAAGDPPETFRWNSHLHALSLCAAPTDALALFARLRLFDVPLDAYTLSFTLKACSHLTRLFMGRAVHALVEKLGFRSDVFLLNTVLHLYASCREMTVARLLFDRMPVRDVVTWNIMITHFSKTGEMESARELFDLMPERSVRSWTAMIAGYVQRKNPREAIRDFCEMEEIGMKPNEVTVVAVLAACADLCALDLGKRVHEYLDRCGFQKNVRVCNTLIDMYIKCGCVETARRVFDEMTERTVVTWSAMICGHAMHGQGREALDLFSSMTQEGLKPNGVTFVGLLHACSHMGLLEEGRKFFTSMTKDYGIAPKIEHFGCMVDLLSRAGLLKEARELIEKMPIKPNSVIWGAILGGARLHKNVEMGEEALRHLVVLDPLNDGYYVVLSNIYAEAGRWGDVARVRRMMKDRGLKKTPGWSTVELGGVVHEFVAGESDHPQIEEIYKMWDELVEEMTRRGYVPDTSAVLLDMEEGEEKEKVLFRHSEKLAVVYGLMNTPPGTPVRVMKNLRVCNDCHAALKLISEIAEREIVVRDRNRFHCFKDGTCSCRDYW